ncbi:MULTISPECIES: tyrosine-type recombinase/integrase [unclassified Acinetobacter]|uniref:tyrosine-type recombinase/integrase n=1 Tax=unclassified Acinetobacter TaxID=196816 RepID=UPI001D17890B|nr:MULTISPECIES: site-specific integrase [unclassified Acinetobacter]
MMSLPFFGFLIFIQRANIPTFKAIAKEYVQEKMEYKSEDYIARFNNSMEKDVYKAFGNKPIKDVSSADILSIMKNTVERVLNQGKHGTGESAANINRRFIGLVMRYAIVTLRVENDPTYAVSEAIESPKIEHDRPFEKHEKNALREKIDIYGGSTTVKNACLAMLYSTLRTVEIRKMEWNFVDFKERIIKFPKVSKRLKQERTMKKNRIHIVPISDQLLNILNEQYAFTKDQKYVFPSPQKRDCMISRTTLNKMLTYIGLNQVTAHDIRATASTELNSLRYNSDWIETQLAHAEANKTRAAYNHAKYLNDRRKMLQDWADIIDSWNA